MNTVIIINPYFQVFSRSILLKHAAAKGFSGTKKCNHIMTILMSQSETKNSFSDAFDHFALHEDNCCHILKALTY